MQILIIANNLSIGIILLPQIFFGYSMINMILLLIFVLAAVKLMSGVIEKYPGESFFSYTQKNFGPNTAKILSILISIKIFFTAALQLKLFSHIIKIYFLPKTNNFVTGLVLVLTAAYLISKGYETRARLCEILIWLIILPLALIFLIALLNIEHIVLDNTKINITAIFYSIFVFSELDYLLLVGPFIKKNAGKKISHAIFFSWLTLIFFMYILKSSINFKTRLPILKLMSTTDIPGGLVQNQDFLITSFIIISFFILISGGIFFSSTLFNFIIPKKICLLICTAVIFLISIIPKNIDSIIIYLLGTFFYFVFPIFILYKNRRAGAKKLNT